MFRHKIKIRRDIIILHRSNISYFNKNHDFIWSPVKIIQENKDNISEIKFGFTAHGIEQLGDIVYADSFKNINDKICSNEPIGVVESVKASVDITPSIHGVITDMNKEFFQLIEDIGGVGFDDIKQLDSYNDENGIFLYSINLDEELKDKSIEYIHQTYMNENEYNIFTER